MPAGEAVWCGTPAICSTAPVLREVCGDLGLYSIRMIAICWPLLVDRLTQDADYRENLRHQIAEAKPHLRTWKTVARGILSAVRPLAS